MTTRNYNLKDIQGVILDMPGQLIVTQGEQAVTVTTNENIYEWLNLYVSKGVLHIELRDNVEVWEFDEMRFEVTIPEPNYIKLEGSGDIIVTDSVIINNAIQLELEGSGDVIVSKLRANHVDLFVEGSGNIRCDEIYCTSVSPKIQGSGNITLTGQVLNSSIDIEGSGDIRSYDMVSQDAVVNSDGSGDCHINVLKTLNVELEGSGSVFYKGNPITTITDEGSGVVSHVN